jgi:ATP-dependent Clp protease adaptor protein ClpS
MPVVSYSLLIQNRSRKEECTNMSGHRYDDDEAILTETKKKDEVKEPPRYRVLLHNDNYTTQEFVVFVLMTVFQHSQTVAEHLMLQVHTQGVAIGGVYSHEIAEMKVSRVMELARECEYPFLCTMEEE